MDTGLALIAYGLLLISAVFLTFFWGRIAYRRMHELHSFNLIRRDKYAMLSNCIWLMSLGYGLLFGSRAYQMIVYGISTVAVAGKTSVLILMGLFILVTAKSGFVWAIHCNERTWAWRLYVGLSILWLILAIGWIDGGHYATN